MTQNQKKEEMGSKKWIRQAVNCYPGVLYSHLAPKLNLKQSKVKWLSPLRRCDYREYKDQNFIDLLGLKLDGHPLGKFWPRGGPHWDALAKIDDLQPLLVEAKSYIKEKRSSRSRASCKESIDKINSSLNETQKFLGADLSVDWAISPHYQYANRLAHLYLLAERNGIDAYLLMICFLNDVQMKGPLSIQDWQEAAARQHADMGLAQDHRLADRIISIYVSVDDLRD